MDYVFFTISIRTFNVQRLLEYNGKTMFYLKMTLAYMHMYQENFTTKEMCLLQMK